MATGFDPKAAVGDRGVVERDPGAQILENLVSHVGGRGLGEGDAEDARRLGAGQQ